MTAGAEQLTPLEVASGIVIDVEPQLDVVGRRAPEAPRTALERAVLSALRRAPCVVSFSGGRDSSAVLAVVTDVARREGLPLPVPVTNLFRDAASANESEWQERVVSHLGLDDWIRVEHTHELDCVGPVATDVLRRHGLLWPFNAHFHVPLLRHGRGGSMLTGIGGDEILSVSSRSRLADVLRGRVRPEARDVLRAGYAVAPRVLRRRVLRRRLPLAYGWLRPAARAAVAAAWAAQASSEPNRWPEFVQWVRRMRYLHVGTASLRLLAADADVQAVHPFLDRDVVAAVAALPRHDRFVDRDSAMRALFADVLPEEILTRRSKASFDEAFWNEPSRKFAANWNGEGVDDELVDPAGLSAEWTSESPDARSFTLVQSAWLATAAPASNGVQQAVD